MTTDLSVSSRAPAIASRMAEAAKRFLESLSPEQQESVQFPFEGDERYFWHYTPILRNGLLVKVMTPPQRQAAFALMETGLSARGNLQARSIMALEETLLEHERQDNRPMPWIRDSEMYYFSIFGEPGDANRWAWKVGGHHIGLHFTIVDRELVAAVPQFFGANPAQSRYGPHLGQRTLAEEEDMARSLLSSLDPQQKLIAIVDQVAPSDILTRNSRVADPNAAPSGLRFAAMSGDQRGQFVRLIRHYVERVADDLSTRAWSRIEAAGLDGVTFAWSGPEEKARGNGHYYAIKGPSFLVEYDNTQNEANHIHSVWRDYANDWAEDLLAAHYASSHRG